MTKLIVCLPLCLVLQDQRPFTCGSAGRADSGPPPMSPAVKRQLEIARCVGAFAVPSATAFPGTLTWTPLRGLSEHLVPRHERFSVDLVAGLGAISSPTAAAWLPLRQAFVSNGPGVLEDLAYTQPLRFLQMCMAHYEREVKGYHCMLFKHERIKGKLLDLEQCECYFREQPFSLHMEWKKGEGQAKRVLYVAGENKDLLLARPALSRFLPVVSRDPEGADAKAAGRYTVKQFGIGLGTRRTITAMEKAKARGQLFVQYYGIESVPQLDGRLCYKFIRKPYVPPEEEGVNELHVYVDVETWLQTGSELRDASGTLLAEYFFRDVQLNPTFAPNQFTREKL